MLNLAVVGYSPENGHPYSFSSIINGYNDDQLDDIGYPAIASYLREAEGSRISSFDMCVSHVWCNDTAVAESIARTANISKVCSKFTDFLGFDIDGVLLLMDESDERISIENFLLESGIKYFVDKPLSSSGPRLGFLKSSLTAGSMMSCSCLRFDPQFNKVKEKIERVGNPNSARVIMTGSWDKYAAHAIEPIIGVIGTIEDYRIERSSLRGVETIRIESKEKILDVICIRSEIPLFKFDFIWEDSISSVQIRSNFESFYFGIKEMQLFFSSRREVIPSEETMNVCNLIIDSAKEMP